ncbi:MAG: hypothetical protein JXA13_12480 [Anaerolineales bacterium]|nr:hypothetical protein [Anaerolineales bacterium]
MKKNKKYPFIAGLINMLLPGSIHIYIQKKWGRFLIIFIGLEIVLALLIGLGVSLQRTPSFNLPQGLCPGALTLIVLVPLFINGMNKTREYNKELKKEGFYQSQMPISQDNSEEQLQKIQKLRDTGLISAQQYENKKRNLSNKK